MNFGHFKFFYFLMKEKKIDGYCFIFDFGDFHFLYFSEI